VPVHLLDLGVLAELVSAVDEAIDVRQGLERELQQVRGEPQLARLDVPLAREQAVEPLLRLGERARGAGGVRS
jgi:hypothetical protein